ncbi:epoxide hydrolase [Pseudomonas sp. SZMC_28357]|uniref:epoxide hydrolase family protein n=1 Tax=Pseudomonas sp. SZMC_28357 TaxID=3074380 RepID=UPI00287219BC|nr:epoxide hydrolase [Pseudomonas sp. SZMC_28357]MDR9753781.1 epoxide hydrolase [Pseudomonas sp. SZMC_28357]
MNDTLPVAHDEHQGPNRRLVLKTGLVGAAAIAASSAPFSLLAQTATQDVRPFEVKWDSAKLAGVLEKVRAYEFPIEPISAGWRYGCDPVFLKSLCDYWVKGFDPQKAVADLNRYPQFVTTIEGLDVHFLHVVGEAKGKRPLLMTHGWPGSVFEFWQAAERLAYPSKFGGNSADAFDLVIPSLPGFGSSGKPQRPIGARTTARLFDSLMRERLGYKTYLAQGGDWGAGVAGWLGLDHAASLRGIHLNLLIVSPASAPGDAAEDAYASSHAEYESRLGAYYQLQSTKPHSLAYAMANNPVGQAAWLIERYHDWSDLRDRPFDQVFSKDQLLTSVMIYIMNDAFASAAWFYTGERMEQVTQMPVGQRVEVPTGFSAYPDSRSPNPPRSLIERGYNLKYWRVMEQGGHFAAMEVPEAFARDIQEWGRSIA